MDTEITFDSEIVKYTNNLVKNIKINDVDINLNLIEYNDKRIIEILGQWQMCLSMLGKGNLFKTKDCMVIIYCLLTDCCKINTINDSKMDLDIYDPVLDRFQRLEIIDNTNRFIKLRIFTVCNRMIIVDCKDGKKYKIYELHNLGNIKEYYGTNKINFDDIVKSIKLEPIFVGNFSDLEDDFKRLALRNIKVDSFDIINSLEQFMSSCNDIERKIQKEYKNFIKVVTVYQ